MNIYLAARYSRFEELQGYRADLLAAGHVVTARWIDGDHSIDNGISIQASDEERARFASEDSSDLMRAECVISFTEVPRSAVGARGGRHVEFGMAIAYRKRLIVVGPRETVFHHLPEVEHFATWPEALAAVGKVEEDIAT